MSGTPRRGPTSARPRARHERLDPFPVAFFAIVVVAAGASGVALLVGPGSTHRYFSWTLRPPAAAALIGGFYVASAVIFGWGMTLRWNEARTLVVGVLGLAIPTLILTLVHNEVFDFSRWQALAWVGLFVAALLSASAMLLLIRAAPVPGRPLRSWCRATLALLAILLMALAIGIWSDRTRNAIARHSPVELIRLTGAYLGAWCSFLAVLCGVAAATGRWTEGRVALVALGVASACAAVAVLRTGGELRYPLVALAVPVCTAGLAVAMYISSRPRP